MIFLLSQAAVLTGHTAAILFLETEMRYFPLKKMILLLLSLCIPLCLCACGNAENKEPEYVLTYAENQPRNYPTSLGGERFAELVKERTDGKIVIQVKYAGEYGTDEEAVNQLQFGGIDFARISLAVIADEVPVLNVLQLPFLYQDSAHMWRVLDGEIGSDLLDTFVDAEVVGLSWYDAGARSFYSISPIRNLSDLKGRTVRVQNSQMAKDMVTCLGAKPVYVDHNDVQYAFETHKIDTAENNWLVYQYLEPEEKKEFQQAVTPLYEKYCADYMDFVQAIQAQKEA